MPRHCKPGPRRQPLRPRDSVQWRRHPPWPRGNWDGSAHLVKQTFATDGCKGSWDEAGSRRGLRLLCLRVEEIRRLLPRWTFYSDGAASPESIRLAGGLGFKPGVSLLVRSCLEPARPVHGTFPNTSNDPQLCCLVKRPGYPVPPSENSCDDTVTKTPWHYCTLSMPSRRHQTST